MDNNQIANKILDLRRQNGWSQKELGDMLGVSNKAVSKWENGESIPKTSTLLKLAELAGLDANELIGLESEPQQKENTEELDRLRAENKALKTKLTSINKRNSRGFTLVVTICIIGIIACSLLPIFLANNSKNNDIKSLGKEGTKIEFSSNTFIPANELERYFFSGNEYLMYDEKTAKLIDADKNSCDVIIKCNEIESDYINVEQKGKRYVYINSLANRLDISEKSVAGFDIYPHTDFSEEVISDDSYITFYFIEDAFKTEFIKYYNSEKEPVSKRITDLNINRKPIMVNIYFYDFDDIESLLGQFFRDEDGNTYFYDYVSGNSYAVGREVSRLVYAEN